jgi:hypothetical protein
MLLSLEIKHLKSFELDIDSNISLNNVSGMLLPDILSVWSGETFVEINLHNSSIVSDDINVYEMFILDKHVLKVRSR